MVKGQFGGGGSTTDEIIIKRSLSRSGGDAGWKGTLAADNEGVLWDDVDEVTVGEAQAVSNSSGPLSGLEAETSLMVARDSLIKTTWRGCQY